MLRELIARVVRALTTKPSDRKPFFDLVRAELFPEGFTQAQVMRIDALLTEVYKNSLPLEHRAYILATAHHETDQFRTMKEYASGKAYEGNARLGNIYKGDGVKFKGRGYVMITGRRNYTDWSRRLGIDLVSNPIKAEYLPVAARICVEGMTLGTFTTKKLSDYTTYKDMRQIVNGHDDADLIAGYAEVYEKAFRA